LTACFLLLCSHTDPGWLQTALQLYYGGADHNCSISTCVGVRNIYSAVIAALAENPNRTFSPEITVFSAWSIAAPATARWWSTRHPPSS